MRSNEGWTALAPPRAQERSSGYRRSTAPLVGTNRPTTKKAGRRSPPVRLRLAVRSLVPSNRLHGSAVVPEPVGVFRPAADVLKNSCPGSGRGRRRPRSRTAASSERRREIYMRGPGPKMSREAPMGRALQEQRTTAGRPPRPIEPFPSPAPEPEPIPPEPPPIPPEPIP